MENNKNIQTAEQYHQLYTKAFARPADISSLAEQALRDLEELQPAMGDK